MRFDSVGKGGVDTHWMLLPSETSWHQCVGFSRLHFFLWRCAVQVGETTWHVPNPWRLSWCRRQHGVITWFFASICSAFCRSLLWYLAAVNLSFWVKTHWCEILRIFFLRVCWSLEEFPVHWAWQFWSCKSCARFFTCICRDARTGCTGYFEVVWYLRVLTGLQEEIFTYHSHSADWLNFALMTHPLLKAVPGNCYIKPRACWQRLLAGAGRMGVANDWKWNRVPPCWARGDKLLCTLSAFDPLHVLWSLKFRCAVGGQLSFTTFF